MERDCESELSKLNIEQNACIYHFGASVIHGQRSNILRLRSIYDSLVYIEVEYKLGELSDEQYHKLREIVDNSLAMIEPYTVVLNPNPEEIVRRLEIRRATGTRKKRDQMCAREDNVDYVGKMNDEFIKIYSNKNVININNNEDEDIKKINDWINGTVLAQSKPF